MYVSAGMHVHLCGGELTYAYVYMKGKGQRGYILYHSPP